MASRRFPVDRAPGAPSASPPRSLNWGLRPIEIALAVVVALPTAYLIFSAGLDPGWAEAGGGLVAAATVAASRTVLRPPPPILPSWTDSAALRTVDLLLAFGAAALMVVAVAGVIRNEFLPVMTVAGLAMFGGGTLLDRRRRWPRGFRDGQDDTAR